jgi:polar amino acid transport system substrate-binding protein
MTRSVLDEVVERGRLRIAVEWLQPPDSGAPPEMYLDPETGEPAGLAPLVGRLIASDLGVELECVDIPWPEQIPALLDGTVDILPKHTLTPRRALSIDFADGRLMPVRTVCLRPRSSGSSKLEDLLPSVGTVAVWHGSSVRLVAEQVFPKARVAEYGDPYAATLAGEADVALGDSVTVRFMERHPDLELVRNEAGRVVVLAQEYNHVGVRPGQERTLRWLNSWYDYHHAQGTIPYWFETWWNSFMVDHREGFVVYQSTEGGR